MHNVWNNPYFSSILDTISINVSITEGIQRAFFLFIMSFISHFTTSPPEGITEIVFWGLC